jgi:hypothetical protein
MKQREFGLAVRGLGGAALCAVLLLASRAGWAQKDTRSSIYTCTDSNGKKLTSDRPIAECSTREQRVLNADGSVRNVIARFPDEAAHRKARNAALDGMRSAVKASEARLELLAKARKPLNDEAEFYNAKTMPATLRAQLEGNETSTEAQRSLIQTQQLEVVRINKLYDAELERLKKLWRGAPAGSLGPLPVGDAGAEAASAAASK